MMNGLQTLSQWRTYFDNPSAPVLGAMNAVFPIGKILGIAPAAYMVDRWGRKSSLWLGLVFLLISVAIQGASINTPMFIVARMFLGAGTAFIAQPSPILVTELAYPAHRAKVTAMYQTFFVSRSRSRALGPFTLRGGATVLV
jgi:MFS family permease